MNVVDLFKEPTNKDFRAVVSFSSACNIKLKKRVGSLLLSGVNCLDDVTERSCKKS